MRTQVSSGPIVGGATRLPEGLQRTRGALLEGRQLPPVATPRTRPSTFCGLFGAVT